MGASDAGRAGRSRPRFSNHVLNGEPDNPVPVKTAMWLLGLCGGGLRAPLGPPEEKTVELLREALRRAELQGAPR